MQILRDATRFRTAPLRFDYLGQKDALSRTRAADNANWEAVWETVKRRFR
jgi:hypothetical protein